jgi:hypothetical protein
VPNLGRIDAMPVRALAARQQIIDRCRVRAPAFASAIAECFAEMSAFGMRLQPQETDDIGGAQRSLM